MQGAPALYGSPAIVSEIMAIGVAFGISMESGELYRAPGQAGLPFSEICVSIV